jgi:Fe(II)/alpha-ketoglutarate-dependent arginine beta-hydroxylase
MERCVLRDDEIQCIDVLVNSIVADQCVVDDPGFLQYVSVRAHELPRRLRNVLAQYRLAEQASVLVISGYPIDEERIGPTPAHWKQQSVPSPTIREEVLLLLCGSLLGDAIGWSTQQQGRIIHDVLPIAEHSHEQLGTGSEQLLWWHTEDAFHELRGDYLGLMCLRNPDGVATTVCSIADVPLDAEQLDVLFRPHFTIRPDESHLRKNSNGRPTTEREASFDRIEEMNRNPKRIAVLTGAKDAPYLRIDPYFMDPVPDPAAQRAVDRLVQSIDMRLQDLTLQPGDVCFLDNYRTVHGRRPFVARYNGTDRWLKRINVARDLRKSRDWRQAVTDRVIG